MQLLHSDDIKTCQANGKTILLSIGGATYTEGGFTSEQQAKAAIDKAMNPQNPQPKEDPNHGKS